MGVPPFQTLMLPVLEASAQGETSISEVVETVAASFGLSEEEKSQLLPSGKQTILKNRAQWAKFYLSKAGLIDTPKKGVFKASSVGLELLKTNPKSIDTKFLLQYPAFAEFHNSSKSTTSENEIVESQNQSSEISVTPEISATPDELLESTHQQIVTALRSELFSKIMENTPLFFEHLIVDLLVAMGYGGNHHDAAKQLGKSGDGGVDGVIKEDVLGLDMIYVQAKRYAPDNSIGRPAIQNFVGSLVGHGATKGVFVTTSFYTKEALEYVKKVPQRVVLIDGTQLTNLMIQFKLGIRTVQTFELQKVDEDYVLDGY